MPKEFKEIYEFGPFRLDTAALALWRGGERIPLPPKSVELLTLLVTRGGEIVSKQEIFDSVWADTFVEDGVLTQNIYSIRRALGKTDADTHYIENIPRRGYRFTSPINVIADKRFTGGERTEISAENDELSTVPPRSAGSKWNIAAAVLLILASAAAGLLYFRSSIEPISGIPSKLEFRRVTDTGDIFFPTLSPDGNFIAYSRRENSYIKDLRTGEEHGLKIDGVAAIGYSQFSNDSSHIYARTRTIIFVPADVARVSAQGGSAETVATGVWGHFSLSPDETRIAFVRVHPEENRQAVIVKDLASGAEKEVSTRNSPLDYYLRSYPAWSPDGKKLAIVTQRSRFQFDELIVLDLERESERTLSTEKLADVQQAVWIENGDAIAVSARIAKNFQLWKIPFPSGEITPITNDIASHRFLAVTADQKTMLTMEVVYFSNIWTAPAENLSEQTQHTFGTSRNDGYFGIDWFADGGVVYTTNDGPANDWNLQILGPKARRLTDADGGEKNDFPDISPDERSIYFTSNRSGIFNIWRIAAGGTDLERVTGGENEQQTHPQISPDGEWLFYIKRRARSSAVWRRSLITGVDEQITPDRFAPAEFLSMSPDGRYLAFHNLSGGDAFDEPDPVFRVGLTEIGGETRILNVNASPGRIFLYWTPDSRSLVYDSFTAEGTTLWRHPIAGGSTPESILTLPKERIFFVKWSKDGKKAAFSRGQQLHNALILTNFE